jgi:hypothetical protein
VSGEIHLDADAGNVPALRAQIGIQFLLADALHLHRSTLFTAAERTSTTWIPYVDELAESFAKQIRHATTLDDADLVLDSFERSGLVRKSSRQVREAVRRIRVAVENMVPSSSDPLFYLSAANRSAHAWTRSLLGTHRIPNDLASGEAPIRVTASEDATSPFVSSSKMAKRIMWRFSTTQLSFWAAFQAEALLRHEYLSHLAPRHPGLSSEVREGWLMSLLIEEIRDEEGESTRFDTGAINLFRDRLTGLSSGSNLIAYASGGSREIPLRVKSINPALYWQITGAIVGLTPDADAGSVDALIDLLIELRPALLRERILRTRWKGLEALAAGLRR